MLLDGLRGALNQSALEASGPQAAKIERLWWLAFITASGSPPAKIISRSMLFRNWRTLPGQLCDCKTAMASSPILRLGKPVACEI